jgi:hypothetical protein
MKTRWLLILIVIVWAAAVTIGYFVVHKPIVPDRALALDRAAALLRVLLTVGWWAVLVMVAGGLGSWLTRGWGASPAERIVFSLGAGLGALSGLTLVGGLLGLFVYRAVWVIGLVLVAIALWFGPLKRLMRAARAALAIHWPEGRLTRIAVVFVVLMLALSFVWALAPPTAWDSLTYHLNGPRLYLDQGRIAQTIDLPYLGFPQLVEMLYALALMSGLPSVAPLIHWTFALLLTVLMADVAARRWNRSTGWLSAAIFLSAPTVVMLAGWPYVDLALTFYSFAAFVALTSERKDGTLLAGALCGLAMATKYTAASVAIALAVLALLAAERGARARLSNVMRFAIAAGLVAAPWYVKTWLTTGNPVYPFFLNGVFWDSWRTWWYGRWGTGLAFTAPWRLITAPFEMTVLGVEGAGDFSATIGPLLLLLAPLSAPAWRTMNADQRRFTVRALIMSVIVYAAWLAQIAGSALLVQSRLLFPIFPVLAVLAAVGFECLRELTLPQLSARRVVGALVVLTFVLTAGGLVWDTLASDRLQFLAGAQSRDEYLLNHLGAHYAAMQAVNDLPPGSRIVFLWEPRSFYCRVECWPDSLLDRWWHVRRTFGSADDIARQWRQQGFSHVLLYQTGYQAIIDAGFDPISLDDQSALAALLQSRGHLVQDIAGAYRLYALDQ